ncbi:major facilitator superfamily domain-containing protein [Lipomyces arxii]|uniref:major facilitator superfamily domain-containing protein n=1 Tax=Lipomyces arxii TaxID=56418 RepID=UPI0034CDC9F7
MGGLLSKLYQETGLSTVVQASTDVHLLFFQRFVRMFAYGQVTIILALFFAVIGVSETMTGLFMTATLLGDVVISFFLTLLADSIGRRKILSIGCVCMFLSGVVFTHATKYWLLLVAAIIGVISPNGNEIGPFRAVEESTLAQLTDLKDRSDLYAWYSLLGNFGTALGTISSGLIVQNLRDVHGWSSLNCYKIIFLVYSVVALLKLGATLMLSEKVEFQAISSSDTEQSAMISESGVPRKNSATDSHQMSSMRKERVSDEIDENDVNETNEILAEMDVLTEPKRRSKWLAWIEYFPRWSTRTKLIVLRLIILFGIDSFASGLASQSWISYYFFFRFDIEEGEIGQLLFNTNMVAAASALVASSISRRLGPVTTMVATHLPSSIILACLGYPKQKRVAMAMLIIRYCTASMDVGPRQAFLSSVVARDERTGVMGVVNVVRTLASAGGPVLMGGFADLRLMPIGFLVAGSMKVVYDLGILASFTKTQLYNN